MYFGPVFPPPVDLAFGSGSHLSPVVCASALAFHILSFWCWCLPVQGLDYIQFESLCVGFLNSSVSRFPSALKQIQNEVRSSSNVAHVNIRAFVFFFFFKVDDSSTGCWWSYMQIYYLFCSQHSYECRKVFHRSIM